MIDSATLPSGAANEESSYRAVSGVAVLALLASPLALVSLVSPGYWWVAAAVAAFNLLSLKRIRRQEGELLGWKAGLLGLAIGVFSATTAMSGDLVRQVMLGAEADRWADRWFKMLRTGHPEQAYQLQLAPLDRQPLDQRLWEFYRTRPRHAEALQEFANRQPIRALLELGGRAEVRLCGTERSFHGILPDDRLGDMLIRAYAVSFGEGPQRQTFLLRLIIARVLLNPQTGESGWQILGASPGLYEEPDARWRR